MKRWFALSLTAFLFASGCTINNEASPQTPKLEASPFHPSFEGHHNVPVTEKAESREVMAQGPSLEVEHSIEGRKVDLYFQTKNFRFAQPGAGAGKNHYGEGHIHLWIDGKKSKQFTNETVIQLPPGKHTIIAELAENNHTPYPNTRIQFEVTVS